MTNRLNTLVKLRTATFVASLILTTAIASAQEKYGAIYFSQVTGSHGYSFDYNSRREAEQVALNECLGAGGTDCVQTTWFRNACGALAVGDGNGWGSHWGNNRNGAEYNAMQSCNQNASGCRVVRWVCTAGASN